MGRERRLIDELQALGRSVGLAVEAGDRAASLPGLRAEPDEFDVRVAQIEKRFSAALGEASRGTERLHTQAVMPLPVTFALAGALFVRRVLRSQQAQRRLPGNACKYKRRGGCLSIAAVSGDGEVRTSVGDEGCGMNEAQLERLFQPFARFDVQPDLDGTGLGLLIVRTSSS